ncbi:hypothetical protein K523DRAFT_366995 [Schizophyllum commune Tattone D]|nr:hypothetical protein K525DRAFT_256075 [Schizophyllum commune Loenen D]KAI5822701.1 hypothetical protein K523DRAFT_366995 [Schizophyllum commune Tattone D]
MASRNAFALLAEDADSSPSPAPAPKPAAPAAPAAPANRGSQKTRGGPASRGGKYYPRGGGRAATSGGAGETAGDDAPQERAKFDNREGRGRGRGRGGPRGRGRQYDRHSQTGKTDSEKKIHQGWGGDEPTSELKAEETGEADATAEAAPEADGDATPATPGGEKAEGRPRREREPEEEDNTLTLDQYLAQKKEKEAAAVPKLEGVRQANEGADNNIWEGAVPLQKPEEDAYFVGKNKSSAPKSRAEKKEKVFIEIDARFERPSRGGRGRGGFENRGRGEGRGEGRGRGRGAGRGRGGRANGAEAPSFSVDDETAFPSLS